MSIEERSPCVMNAEVEKIVCFSSGSSPMILTRKVIAESDSRFIKRFKVKRDRIRIMDYSWYSRNLTMEDAVVLSNALIELSSINQDDIIKEELRKNGY